MPDFEDPHPNPALKARLAKYRTKGKAVLADPMIPQDRKDAALRALELADALEKFLRRQIEKPQGKQVEPPPWQLAEDAAATTKKKPKKKKKKKSKPTKTVFQSAGYALCVTIGYASGTGSSTGRMVLAKNKWKPHPSVEECIDASIIAPAVHKTHMWDAEDDPHTWQRHSADVVEDMFNHHGQDRLVVRKSFVFEDLEAVSLFLTADYCDLPDYKINDIVNLLDEVEAALQKWPPREEQLRYFVTFEVFEIYSSHQQPIEGAEWIIKGKYYLKPWGQGQAGYKVSGPGLMLEHAETREEARPMVSQFLSNGVVPSEVRWRKRSRNHGLILVFLFSVLALVVALI